MDMLAPEGPVYQAGTLSGNPLAMYAGMSVLKNLNSKAFEKLDSISEKIYNGICKNIEETGTKAIVSRLGSMMTLFFTDKKEINNYEDALGCDTSKYGEYFKLMLDMGVYLPPSQFECCFFSLALTNFDVDRIIKANKTALNKMK